MSQISARRHLGLIVGLVALLPYAGCGPSEPVRIPAPVSGKVSYKGTPLTKGTITFQPPSGAQVVGDINPDGTYNVMAIVGPNTVMIVNREPDPGPLAPDSERRQIAAAKAAAEASKSVVPNEYSTPASPLKYEVKNGENKADFDIP